VTPASGTTPKDIFCQKYGMASMTFGSLQVFVEEGKMLPNPKQTPLLIFDYTLHKYKRLTRNQDRRELGPREISFNKSSASPGR